LGALIPGGCAGAGPDGKLRHRRLPTGRVR
jgi:hypothetical protein